MVEIGNVEIPIVFSVEEDTEAEVDEIAPLPAKDQFVDRVGVKHEAGVIRLEISGYLNVEVHSSNLTLSEQKDEVRKLRGNGVSDNSFEYLDYKGYLLIENVDLTDDSDSRIVNEVVIEATYYPWPKFYSGSEP